MPLYGELAALLDDVAGRVDRWTRQEAWQPEPGSPGAAELANTELRADGSPWGERPTRTVFQLGQMQMKMVVEYARSTALLVAAERPPPGIEVETRAALEAASVTWWLFAPGLTARQRVCRLQLLRRNSARELARSIAEVGADPAAAAGETVPAIEAYGQSLGLAPFGQGGDELEGQIRPRYTARVKDLTTELGTSVATASTPVWPMPNWQGCGACSERPRRPCRTGSRSIRQSRTRGFTCRHGRRPEGPDGARGEDCRPLRVAVTGSRGRVQRDHRPHEHRDDAPEAVATAEQ